MGFVVVIVIVSILYLAAALAAITLFTDIAKMKGHYKDGTGVLWFIGLFATPICLGLLVAALPDRGQTSTVSSSAAGSLPRVPVKNASEVYAKSEKDKDVVMSAGFATLGNAGRPSIDEFPEL